MVYGYDVVLSTFKLAEASKIGAPKSTLPVA
jgi:hypothetical protein